MRIFGYTIIKTACYDAEKKRVERLTAAYQQENRSHEAQVRLLQEKMARLEEGSNDIKKAMEFMPKGLDVVESFKLLQQFLFSIPKDMSIEQVLKKVQEP